MYPEIVALAKALLTDSCPCYGSFAYLEAGIRLVRKCQGCGCVEVWSSKALRSTADRYLEEGRRRMLLDNRLPMH